MSKKTAIIIILGTFLTIFISLIVAYFLIVGTDKKISEIEFEDVKEFFPFGRPTEITEIEIPSIPEDGEILEEKIELPILRQISFIPTAGAISIQEGEENIIKYTEKAAGHIYETRTDILTQQKISNTTIPKIHEALWVDGESLIIRYLDDEENIKSFYAQLKEKQGVYQSCLQQTVLLLLPPQVTLKLLYSQA